MPLLTRFSPVQLLAFWERWIDPPASLLGRVVLGLLVLSESLICAIWIFALSSLGEGYALMALFPYTYIVISYTSLLLFYRSKRFEYFTFTQLVMLLVIPFFMQWIVGGFEASSGIAVWAVLSPVGALMILGTRQSTPWFLLFIVLAVFSWATNDIFAGYALPIPKYTRNIFFIVNVAGLSTILYFVMRYFEVQKAKALQELDYKNQQLVEEQGKSDRLLLNILPKSIADRLKKHDKRIADSYESVTIMFADLVDFTRISAGMAPDALVDMLNLVFSRFDELTEKYGLEKIKTIGDAYMVVGGAPTPRPDHAEAMADLALDMQKALAELSVITGKMLMMRIGINSGPVIAGVIGSTKFNYDLWGDTVNMASRMEHYGLANVIQVSKSTYQLLEQKYRFEERGLVTVKGKGKVETYLLLGKTAAATDDKSSVEAENIPEKLPSGL